MIVVKNPMKFIFISTILTLSLLLFTVSLPIVNAESFMLDVYGTEASPRRVDKGDEVTISGDVKLVNAPSGYHLVSVDWYVDDTLEHTATYSMKKSQVKEVSWIFDTSGFSFGQHDVKINATVDGVSDVDSNIFYIEEEIELNLDDFEVDPSTVCVNEDETVELSIEVTLDKGPDDTDVIAEFYIKEGGYWNFIDKEDKTMDEDDEKTFSVLYDYNAQSLDEGRYNIKVFIEAEGEKIVEYANLDVEECFPIDGDIEVGWITIDPEYPEVGDVVLASTPIRLYISRTLPEDVYVKAYVDGKLIDSTTMKFKHLVEKTFTFTFDTRDYSEGTHTVEVKATVDSVTDTSRRTFILGQEGEPEGIHCLNVDLGTEDLKPGEDTIVNVEVTNCGSVTERNIKVKLEAFSRIYYSDISSISPSGDKETEITIKVPEDAEDEYMFSVRAWNSYTSDSTSKEFTVSFGEPLIEVKPEYQLERCRSNEIAFSIVNIGDVTDTFTLTMDGPTWIRDIPEEITLEPDERGFVTIYAIVPCDADEGYYPVTITTKNTEEYSVVTDIKVVKPWTWPSLPVGLFIVPAIAWLPWLVLLIVLIAFYLFYKNFMLSRKRPMFK